MVAVKSILTLAIPLLAGTVRAIDLDVNSADSIKSAAKTLASALLERYNDRDSDVAPGLFGESGYPYFWWEFGAVWGALVEYSHLTGDSQFDDVVAEALQFQLGEDRNFMPVNQTKSLGNDDQSTWALAAMTAAEVGFKDPEGGKWIDVAKTVFDNQVARWDDETCDGGLRWQIFPFNNGYNYKNSMSSGNLFLLSARLAQATGNETYSEWAEKVFEWTQDVGFMTEDYHVFDGSDAETDCERVSHIQWTYPHATYTEGAAIMYNLTDGDDQWRDAVRGFVNSSSIFQTNETSILFEVACERNGNCDLDQKIFKGLAARSYARSALVAPSTAEQFHKVLEASAKGAASNCEGEGLQIACGEKWYEENDEVSGLEDRGMGEVFTALEVVQSLLYPQAEGVQGGNSSSTSPGSPTESGSPTGTGAPSEHTGAASKMNIAWGVVLSAGLASIFRL